MTTIHELDRCLAFINCHVKPPSGQPCCPKLAVTISRQAGSGGQIIAAKVASLLQASDPPPGCPWVVLDRNLMEKVLEDHNLPTRLAANLPEDRVTELEDILHELFGAQPYSWNLVRLVTETMLKLAELGHVILVGRGGAVVAAGLPHVFHVRLIGSWERRMERLQQREGLTARAAAEFMTREDQGRRRYLHKYFGANIDDPMLYHVVLNTDRIEMDPAAHLIADAAIEHVRALGAAAAPVPRPVMLEPVLD